MIKLKYNYKLTYAHKHIKSFDNGLKVWLSVWNLALKDRQNWANVSINSKKISIQVHECVCGYKTDRDVAAAQLFKKRRVLNLNADGQAVFKNVCGEGLAEIEISSQESWKQKIQTVKFGSVPQIV